jgi:hypothetical protein
LNNSPFFKKDENKKDHYWIVGEKKLLSRYKRHRSNRIIINIEDLKTQNMFNKIIFGLFAIKKFNSYRKMSKDSGFCESTIAKKIKWNTHHGKINKTQNLIDPESDLEDETSLNSFKRINKLQLDLWIEHKIVTKQIEIERNKKIVALFAPNTYTLKDRYHKSNDNNGISTAYATDSLLTAVTGLPCRGSKKKIIKKRLHPNSKDRFVLEIQNILPNTNLYKFNKEVYGFQNYLSDYSVQYQ